MSNLDRRLIEMEAAMYNPIQPYYATHVPLHADEGLDEEQRALRYGQIVQKQSRNPLALQTGRFLIRIGENLTGDCPHAGLSKEIA